VIFYYIKRKIDDCKVKITPLSYSVIFSLPLESILSKISSYKADLSDSVISFIFIYNIQTNIRLLISDKVRSIDQGHFKVKAYTLFKKHKLIQHFKCY
jgi:hypothetical protein